MVLPVMKLVAFVWSTSNCVALSVELKIKFIKKASFGWAEVYSTCNGSHAPNIYTLETRACIPPTSQAIFSSLVSWLLFFLQY